MLFYVLFVCKCLLPLGDNPIAVNKYIISYLKYGKGKEIIVQVGIGPEDSRTFRFAGFKRFCT
jgi:hypothetical protein